MNSKTYKTKIDNKINRFIHYFTHSFSLSLSFTNIKSREIAKIDRKKR